MKKEYAAKYKASGNNQDSSYKLGTEMVDNLENFEKKGTARTIEKVVNSVPEFKKNFEERIINRMTSKNHHRFSEFSINDCCLNAIADTIMSTKKPNICNEIIKELGVSVKDVNDIITAKAEMNKRNDTNLHARHV